jgi:hypothetical protein
MQCVASACPLSVSRALVAEEHSNCIVTRHRTTGKRGWLLTLRMAFLSPNAVRLACSRDVFRGLGDDGLHCTAVVW